MSLKNTENIGITPTGSWALDPHHFMKLAECCKWK